jgi:hypothetical protein
MRVTPARSLFQLLKIVVDPGCRPRRTFPSDSHRLRFLGRALTGGIDEMDEVDEMARQASSLKTAHWESLVLVYQGEESGS